MASVFIVLAAPFKLSRRFGFGAGERGADFDEEATGVFVSRAMAVEEDATGAEASLTAGEAGRAGEAAAEA